MLERIEERSEDRVHYFSGQKNAHHGHAIAEGFSCRTVPVEDKRLEKGAHHFLGGLQFGSLGLMQQLFKNHDRYVFFDRAYFGGGPGTNRMRAVPSAYQHNWMNAIRGARDVGQRLLPWHSGGDYIMVVPPSRAICQLFGLGNWDQIIIRHLTQITDRPLMVSYKGDGRPLMDRLVRCHAVVTWTSNVAVEAVCAGVPVFVSQHSAARPMGTDLDAMTAESLESPRRPDNREDWANGLAWGQFSLEEIKSGFAREVMDSEAVEV